jgi:acylaminoacyl-peptidase
LLGNVGRQDVQDVIAALDLVIGNGMADPARVAVLGGSHGGFLATHLIGQAPERFTTAIARNPVCNVSCMVGITDIPDWCYVEAFGKEGLLNYSEAPSVRDLTALYQCSPIAHLSKVKVPTLFLLGAQDRRVPVSNGFQYVQALRARGQEVKVILFPEDIHAIDRPQSDFESFLNIGVWLKRFMQ